MINFDKKYTWLITGCAGFIGSNLLEYLLLNDQQVVGIDNFVTGYKRNLDEVAKIVHDKYDNFVFYEGDIRDYKKCLEVTKNVDFVLHQAALGSVPRSINDPMTSVNVNIDGFITLLFASKENQVKRFIYASSSSVYGDSICLPKIENVVGTPLSPYAATKLTNEIFAQVFNKNFGIDTIGLRYFNVFGKRQDPNGAYAAVIPLWFKSLINEEELYINGDGSTSRDFCYIDNVIEANILSALTQNIGSLNKVYNVAFGKTTTLNDLFKLITNELKINNEVKPLYRDFRVGDVQHSHADISLIKTNLGYSPKYSLELGLKHATSWYKDFFKKK